MEENIAIKLSLENGSFGQQMTAINKEVRDLDRNLKNAGKGIDDYGNSYQGLDNKIKSTEQKIDLFNTKLEKQKSESERLTDVVDKQKAKLSELEQQYGKNSKEYEKQAKLIIKNSQKLQRLNTDINSTKASLTSFGSELSNAKSQFENLSNGTKSLEGSLKEVDSAFKLTESEIKRLNSELTGSGQGFQRLANDITLIEAKISSSNSKIGLYENAIRELEQELNSNKDIHQQLGNEISQLESRLSQAKSEYGENSNEARQLNNELLQLRDSFNRSGNEINQAVQDLNRYQTELNNTQTSVNGLQGELEDMNDRMTGGGFDLGSLFDSEKLGVVKDLLRELGIEFGGLGLLAEGAGLAIAGVFAQQVISGALTYDKALTDLQLNFGATKEKAEQLMNTINEASNCGYNFESVSEAVGMLSQRFKLGQQDTVALAKDMSLLNSMGFETSETTRFMTTAMNDWGMTSEQAMDMVIAGQQQGLNISGDWMDTLTEYSPIFSQMGLSGQESFNLIKDAMNATGVESDKAADMLKEFTLTMTDGSKASKDAFKDIGLDIDDVKEKINNGSMTMGEALQLVSGKIMGIGDETERAKALQDIFKGTVEYGSDSIVQAWSNVNTEINNTAGAMENAKDTYEGSAEAMKQDISSEWTKLTTTIGSLVLPLLKEVLQFTNNAIESIKLLPEGAVAGWTTLKNGVQNALEGAHAQILKFESNSTKALANFYDSIGMDGKADKLREGAKKLDAEYKISVDNIKKRGEETKKNSEKFLNDMDKIWNNAGNNVKIYAKSYDDIPKEIQTQFKANGITEEQQAVSMYNGMLQTVPPQVMTLLKADNAQALQGATSLKDALGNIPIEKTIKVLADTFESGKNIDQVKQTLELLPVDKKISIITEMSKDTNSNPAFIKQMIDSLPKEKRTKVLAETGDAIKKIETLNAKKVADKESKANVDTSKANKDVDDLNNKKVNTKPFKVTDNGSSDLMKSKAQQLDSKIIRHKAFNVSDKGSSDNMKNKVTGLDNKKVNNKKFNVSDGGSSSSAKSKVQEVENQKIKNKTFTITAVVNTIKNTFNNVYNKVKNAFSAGGEEFSKSVNKAKSFAPLSVAPSESPIPQSTGNSSVPMSTGASVKPSQSPIPSGANTGASNNDVLGSFVDSTNFNINQFSELESRLSRIANEITKIDKEMSNAFGKDKLFLIEKQNALYNSQLKVQSDIESKYKEQRDVVSSLLRQRGFMFNSQGDISNYQEKLIQLNKEYERLSNYAEDLSNQSSKQSDNEGLKNQAEYAKKRADESSKALELTKKYISEYESLTNNIYGAEQKYLDLNNTILKNKQEIADINFQMKEKVQKELTEQLQTTSNVQKKITDVYKKEIEDRKELIDEESKSKIDAINKEKQAYNDSRKEINYKNDIKEQQDAINELQKDLDNASRDTSIVGQKRFKELSKQMDEMNKKLQYTVQSKLDEQVNEGYDREADRLKEETDRSLESLNKLFDDKGIANMVNNSLATGIFKDIDGNVSSLTDTMNNFFDNSLESFGAMSGILKNDLNNELSIALNTMKSMSDISKTLNIDYDSEKLYGNKGSTINNNQSIVINNNNNVPLVNITGANTQNIDLNTIQKMIQDYQNKMLEQIVKKI
ncbi:hypothetical protein KD33_07745 [Clostridium sp. NCR]|nr:hypothetical protein KD33_07745 [Clostridium sp. NCR]